MLGHHARDATATEFQAARRAMLMDRPTEFHHRACDRRRGHGRIRGAVARREHAAAPRAPGGEAALGGFRSGEHVRRDAGGACDVAPARPGREFDFVVAEVEQAATTEASAFAGLRSEALPQLEAARRHRQFPLVAILLAAPAPVAARLLCSDAPLLQQRDFHPALREVVRREGADDAATDDHGVGRGWQGGRGLYVCQRCGHAVSLLNVDSPAGGNTRRPVAGTTAGRSGPGSRANRSRATGSGRRGRRALRP